MLLRVWVCRHRAKIWINSEYTLSWNSATVTRENRVSKSKSLVSRVLTCRHVIEVDRAFCSWWFITAFIELQAWKSRSAVSKELFLTLWSYPSGFGLQLASLISPGFLRPEKLQKHSPFSHQHVVRWHQTSVIETENKSIDIKWRLFTYVVNYCLYCE